MEPSKKYVNDLGVGRSIKIVTKYYHGEGEGIKAKSDVTTSKRYIFNSRIRMTLIVVMIPLHLLLM